MSREDRLTVAFPLTVLPERDCSWPTVSLWPPAALRRQKITLGPIAYARGFEQRAYTDQDLLFPSFQDCVEAGREGGPDGKGISLRDFSPEDKSRWDTFAGVDLSSDKRPGTVIFLLSVMPDGRKIPRVIRCGRWKSPETLVQMQQVEQVYQPRVWMVENNGFQQSLIDMAQTIGEVGLKDPAGGKKRIKLTFTTRIEPFTTGSQKVDPTKGLPAIDVEFANLGWVIPMRDREGHPEACSCGFCRWLTEAGKYPHWPTTDAVMAMWFAWDAAMAYSRYCQPEEKRFRRKKSRKEKRDSRKQKIGQTALERAFK